MEGSCKNLWQLLCFICFDFLAIQLRGRQKLQMLEKSDNILGGKTFLSDKWQWSFDLMVRAFSSHHKRLTEWLLEDSRVLLKPM